MPIRIATVQDVPAMLAIYAPYVEQTTYSFEYAPPTLEAFTDRFLHYNAQFPWLVWEESGKIGGYAYATAPFERAAYRWCAEPSIYLAPEAQGKGIGRQLYTALEEVLRRQGYQVLYAIITSENVPSLAFHEALGYHTLTFFPNCGFKFGRWLGITWMEKRLSPVEVPSNPPISWQELVKTDRNFLKVLDKMPLS